MWPWIIEHGKWIIPDLHSCEDLITPHRLSSWLWHGTYGNPVSSPFLFCPSRPCPRHGISSPCLGQEMILCVCWLEQDHISRLVSRSPKSPVVVTLNLAFELTRKCSQSAAPSGFTKAIVGREPTDKNSTEGYFRALSACFCCRCTCGQSGGLSLPSFICSTVIVFKYERAEIHLLVEDMFPILDKVSLKPTSYIGSLSTTPKLEGAIAGLPACFLCWLCAAACVNL